MFMVTSFLFNSGVIAVCVDRHNTALSGNSIKMRSFRETLFRKQLHYFLEIRCRVVLWRDAVHGNEVPSSNRLASCRYLGTASSCSALFLIATAGLKMAPRGNQRKPCIADPAVPVAGIKGRRPA